MDGVAIDNGTEPLGGLAEVCPSSSNSWGQLGGEVTASASLVVPLHGRLWEVTVRCDALSFRRFHRVVCLVSEAAHVYR